MHGITFGHRQRHGIGEVVLALRIVVAQLRDPAAQTRGGGRDQAGVDLADLRLPGTRILLLHDRTDTTRGIAHDTPVSVRVLELHRQHR